MIASIIGFYWLLFVMEYKSATQVKLRYHLNAGTKITRDYDTNWVKYMATTTLRYRVKENSILARMAALILGADKVAIVLGATIHLHHTGKAEFLANKPWLRHELMHIEQYAQHGSVLFIVLYLWQSLKNGYYHNSFEVAARRAEHIEWYETAFTMID
jgi:hypothetical protein